MDRSHIGFAAIVVSFFCLGILAGITYPSGSRATVFALEKGCVRLPRVYLSVAGECTHLRAAKYSAYAPLPRYTLLTSFVGFPQSREEEQDIGTFASLLARSRRPLPREWAKFSPCKPDPETNVCVSHRPDAHSAIHPLPAHSRILTHYTHSPPSHSSPTHTGLNILEDRKDCIYSYSERFCPGSGRPTHQQLTVRLLGY